MEAQRRVSKPKYIWKTNPGIRYAKLNSLGENSEDSEADLDNVSGIRRLFGWGQIWSSVISFLVGVGVCALGLLVTPRLKYLEAPVTPVTVQTAWVACGHTPTEARLNNCHFEPMMTAWIPDGCYYPEPSDEYDPIGYYQWYSDEGLEHPITGTQELDALRAGNYSVLYAPGGYHHQEHCLYAWRKLAIAVERNLPLMDSRSAEFHHSTHCAQMLTADFRTIYEAPGTELHVNTSTTVPMIYLECVPTFQPADSPER